MSKATAFHLQGGNGSINVNAADGATTFEDVDGTLACTAIQAANNTDLAISALTDATAINGDGTSTNRQTAVPAGGFLYGRFTAITVSSGVARCYRE